jgi:hypothetical protein
MLWGVYCTSSWTWCIGMYLPFVLLRLWGWPGFWAFFVPNVIGCAMFGFLLDRERSHRLVRRLAGPMALFSAVTVAYQCYFAGWVSHGFFVSSGAMATVAATGVPIALLVAAVWLATRGERALLGAGAAAFAIALGAAAMAAGLVAGGDAGALPREPLVPEGRLAWAVPTIVAGFLLCPYLDLTFHRALERAPQPRVAFGTFGLTFAAMLLGVASLYDPATGTPTPGLVIGVLWGVQLCFTMAVHLRELWLHTPTSGWPPRATAALVAGAVLLATPAFAFTLGPRIPTAQWPLWRGAEHVLLPGEPVYLAFLGAYGLLFPALLWFRGWRGARRGLLAVLAVGVPCYLLGAWDFATYLMPIPIVLALLLRNPAQASGGRPPAARAGQAA